MKKTIIVTLVVIVTSLTIGIPTYSYIKKQQKETELNEKLQSNLGKDQGMTELILRNISGTISYKELFESCEKSIKDRSDLIVELRGLYPNMPSELRDSLSDFLDVENELMRLMSMSARKQLNASNISEEPRHQYSFYYTDYDTNPDKWERYTKEADEMYEFNDKISIKYSIMIQKEKGLDKIMKKSKLRFISIYPKYINILKDQFPTKEQYDMKLKTEISKQLSSLNIAKQARDSIAHIEMRNKQIKDSIYHVELNRKQNEIREKQLEKKRKAIKRDNNGIIISY